MGPKIVAAHQPCYLPWLGYFDKLRSVDEFVLMDAVQLQKRAFMTRNLIQTAQGPKWLSVPVRSRGNHIGGSIIDLEVNDSEKWRNKHLETIRHSYRRARNFAAIIQDLEQLYASPTVLFVDFCLEQLACWNRLLGLHTKITRMSTLTTSGKKSDLVMSLCQAVGATKYLSGSLARNYLDVERFREHGIDVVFQEFEHPVYPQVHGGEFVPNLGIVDYLMNA